MIIYSKGYLELMLQTQIEQYQKTFKALREAEVNCRDLQNRKVDQKPESYFDLSSAYGRVGELTLQLESIAWRIGSILKVLNGLDE